MPPKKRTLTNDEGDPPRPAKSLRARDGDAPNSGSRILTQKDIETIKKRPQRSNQGQGGVGYQLAQLEKKLRPDLDGTRQSKTAVVIPNGVPTNDMAPQEHPKQVKKRSAPVQKVPILVRKKDPPLGHGVPKPSQQKIVAHGTVFGFHKTNSSEHEKPPTIRAGPSQTNQRVTVTHALKTRKDQGSTPLPPAKARITDRALTHKPVKPKLVLQDIAPDSEPERTRNNNKSHDKDLDYNESDQEDVDMGGGTRRLLEIEDEDTDKADANEADASDDEYEDEGESDEDDEDEGGGDSGVEDNKSGDEEHIGSKLSPEDLAEMALDPFSNELEDNFIDIDNNRDLIPDPMIIDENSPDEDERVATNALNGIFEGSSREDEEAPYSVLAAHHRTNRRVRAPNSERLTQARHRQSESSTKAHTVTKQVPPTRPRHMSADKTTDNNDADNESEARAGDIDEPLQKQHANHSTQDSKTLPTQMQYYKDSAAWTDILENAKNEYRLYIHTQDPFPERTKATLQRAGDCVLEMMAAYEDDPRNTELLDDSYYDLRSMSILIFEDGASYRGQLKTLCRLLTALHYSKELQPDCPNQEDYSETLKRNAERLRKKGFFLQGDLDERGKTSNFGNPLIATVCRAFYYSKKKSCLSHIFPKDFVTLPKKSLAMVCACIANCIDEYADGTQITLKFDGDGYAEIHEAIMDLISRLEENHYHGAKFDEMLKEVARVGRMQSKKGKPTPDDMNLDIILD